MQLHSPPAGATPAGADQTAPRRFTLVMFVSLHPAGAVALGEFRRQAATLVARHDVRVERVLQVTGKGQLIGTNGFDAPDLIQVISLPSADAFKAYVADPEYQALAKVRDAGVRQMTAFAGLPVDIAAIFTPGRGPESSRQYGVALVRFKPGGEAGLDEFNRRAGTLFERHGVHVESMLGVLQTLTPVGAPVGMNPQRVVVFFLDDKAALPAYVVDPEYKALAPLRDNGLETYDLFVGNVSVS